MNSFTPMRSLFVPFMFAEEFRKTQLREIELKSNPSGKKRGHEGAGEAAEICSRFFSTSSRNTELICKLNFGLLVK